MTSFKDIPFTCDKDCGRCGLAHNTSVVMIEQKEAPPQDKFVDYLLVGEAASYPDDKVGHNWSGDVGEVLETVMSKVALRDLVGINSNLVRCIPYRHPKDPSKGTRYPEKSELEACQHYLLQEIAYYQPKLIISLGTRALEYFTGRRGVSKASGNIYDWELKGLKPYYIMEFLRRNPDKLELVENVNPDDLDNPLILETVWSVLQLDSHSQSRFREGQESLESSFKVIPTLNPAAILRGAKDAEAVIGQAFDSASRFITGKSNIPFDNYITLDTVDKVIEYVDLNLKLFEEGEIEYNVPDVETSYTAANHPDSKLLTIAISHEPGQAAFIPLEHKDSPFNDLELKAVYHHLDRMWKVIPVANQNLLFDIIWLRSRGMSTDHIYFDTFLASWWLNGDKHRHGLEYLASRYVFMLNHKKELEDEIASKHIYEKVGRKQVRTYQATYADCELETLRRYGGSDTDSACRLVELQKKKIVERGEWEPYQRLMVEMIELSAEMQTAGVKVIKERLEKSSEDYQKAIDSTYQWMEDMGYAVQVREQKRRIYVDKLMDEKGLDDYSAEYKSWMEPENWGEFSLGSNDDLAILFAKVLALPLQVRGKPSKKHPRGQFSCAKAILEEQKELALQRKLSNPRFADIYQRQIDCIEKVLEWRKDSKLYGSYVKPFLDVYVQPNGMIHPRFMIGATKTGRWRSADPSIHIVPYKSGIKQALRSRFPLGVILGYDLSQAELRIMTSLTKDPTFVDAYASGQDVHRQIASRVFKKPPEEITDAERRHSKCVTGETRILTNKGEVEIKDIVDHREHGENKPYKGDLKVFTPFGYRDIETTYFAEKQAIVEVTLEDGKSMRCTPNHRFVTDIENDVRVPAEELKPGDEVWVWEDDEES